VTLSERVGNSLRLPRTLAALSGFFGGVALLLATIGLYGLMSYTVARRRNEIGVRIALGAEPGHVVRMVIGEVGRLLIAGVVLGTLLSLFVTRLLAGALYGVEPNDPLTMVSAIAMLTTVAFGASLLPARRAARFDPIVALRHE
jgi:ABC-type antimicrobial peptide transport system permease subunit